MVARGRGQQEIEVTRVLCCILIFCCSRPVFADRVPLHQTRQYAYISGYGGIFGFRVKSDGRLQSLQIEPLAKGLFLDQLLVDTRAKTILGTSIDNKLYSYTVEPTGHLALKSVIAFDADSKSAVIDSQAHLLYAADSDHSVLVYDISNPSHLVRRQNIETSTTIQNVAVDQFNHLLLIECRTHTAGQSGNVLLRYSIRPQSQLAQKKATFTPVQQGINTLTAAGPYLVAGNENMTLTVYRIGGRRVQAVSRQPLLGAEAAHLPTSIVYRRRGSFLYISTFYGAGSAQAAQPASTVAVCHLSADGRLGFLTATGKPVPNPRPCLDETGRFLYIVGEEGTVDAYKVAFNGLLAPVGKRITVVAPTKMVFVGR